MEEIGTTILSTSHCEFYGGCLCAYAYKITPLALIHPLTKQIVLYCIKNHRPASRSDPFTSSYHVAYKPLPSIKNIFTRALIFLVSFLISSTPFSWACGSLCEPQKFFFFVHLLVCPITHSYLDGFQPNLVQHSPHVCSTCHTVFSLKNTLKCVY